MDAHSSLLLLATKEVPEVIPSTQNLVQENGRVGRKTNTVQLKVTPLQCGLHGSTNDDCIEWVRQCFNVVPRLTYQEHQQPACF